MEERLRSVTARRRGTSNRVKECHMTLRRKLLLSTLLGHVSLLESSHPDKAGTRLARRTRQYLEEALSGGRKNARRKNSH